MMTLRTLGVYFAAAGVCCSVLSGCRERAERPWEIVAHNQSGSWCEVAVNMGPGSQANAPDLANGERRVLLTGSTKQIIHTVKVVCNRREQIVRLEVEVPTGKSYLIPVEADGQVRTSVSNQ